MVQAMRQSLDGLRSMAAGAEGESPALSRSERWEAAQASLAPGRLALLEGLEDVDWPSLQHAYGPAGDVPYFLRLLLADDEPVCESAWGHLYNSLLRTRAASTRPAPTSCRFCCACWQQAGPRAP